MSMQCPVPVTMPPCSVFFCSTGLLAALLWMASLNRPLAVRLSAGSNQGSMPAFRWRCPIILLSVLAGRVACYTPSWYLLRGGTMSQGLNGIQSLSERLSVPDWITFVQRVRWEDVWMQADYTGICNIIWVDARLGLFLPRGWQNRSYDFRATCQFR